MDSPKFSPVQLNIDVSNKEEEDPKPEPDTCAFYRFIGGVLTKLSPYNERIIFAYHFVLYSCGIFAITMIVCNIFDNRFWISDLIRSDTQHYMVSAYICLMVSYGLTDFFYLRVCLAFACISFILWALFAIPGVIVFDCVIWNVFMFILNIKGAFLLKYSKRYIPFSDEFEQLYENEFKQFLDRSDFEKLVRIGTVKTINEGVILRSKGSNIDELGHLIKGKIEILRSSDLVVHRCIVDHKSIKLSPEKIESKRRQTLQQLEKSDIEILMSDKTKDVLNIINKNQFIDGLQWIANGLLSDDVEPECAYETAAVSITDCVYIGFPKDAMIKICKADSRIRQAMFNSLSVDVAYQYRRAQRFAKAKTYLHEQ